MIKREDISFMDADHVPLARRDINRYGASAYADAAIHIAPDEIFEDNAAIDDHLDAVKRSFSDTRYSTLLDDAFASLHQLIALRTDRLMEEKKWAFHVDELLDNINKHTKDIENLVMIGSLPRECMAHYRAALSSATSQQRGEWLEAARNRDLSLNGSGVRL